MDHPKCATCKHFGESKEWEIPPSFGKCDLIAMTCNMVVRENGASDFKVLPEFSDHLAGVMDGESFHAALHPHPEFYCPMHSDLMPDLNEVFPRSLQEEMLSGS